MGSEMCIRDRLVDRTVATPLAEDAERLLGVDRELLAVRFLDDLAVSYTHLTLPTIYSV